MRKAEMVFHGISIAVVIGIILRWETISMKIAQAAVKILTGGIPVIVAVVLLVTSIARYRWRRYWRYYNYRRYQNWW